MLLSSSPCAPAEARRWFFFDFGEGNLVAGILQDFFLTYKIKAQNSRAKFRSIFREKIRSSKKTSSCQLRSADVNPKSGQKGAKHVFRNNRKGGTASLRSRTCINRNAVFSAHFKGLSLYFLYQKGNLILTKTGLDTYLIRIQTRTPPVTVPPLWLPF